MAYKGQAGGYVSIAQRFGFGKKASGSDFDWTAKNQELAGLIRAGKAREARVLAQEILEWVERRFRKDAPEKATTYNNMGMVLMLEKDFEMAEECFMEALAMRRRLLGRNHKECAPILMNLIHLYKLEAQEILLETKETIEQGKDQPVL